MMINQQYEQHEIDLFRREFFAVIESDIKIMQENETVRFNSYKIRDKMIFKME